MASGEFEGFDRLIDAAKVDEDLAKGQACHGGGRIQLQRTPAHASVSSSFSSSRSTHASLLTRGTESGWTVRAASRISMALAVAGSWAWAVANKLIASILVGSSSCRRVKTRTASW